MKPLHCPAIVASSQLPSSFCAFFPSRSLPPSRSFPFLPLLSLSLSLPPFESTLVVRLFLFPPQPPVNLSGSITHVCVCVCVCHHDNHLTLFVLSSSTLSKSRGACRCCMVMLFRLMRRLRGGVFALPRSPVATEFVPCLWECRCLSVCLCG